MNIKDKLPVIKHLALKHFIRLHKWVVVLVILLVLAENAVLVLNNLQNKTPALGLKFEGKSMTGLGREQIEGLVKQKAQDVGGKPLKFNFQNQTFEIKPKEVGVGIDPRQFTNQLLSQGRVGNPLEKLISQNQALLGLKDISISGAISQTLLNLKMIQIQNEVNKDPLPKRPDFAHDINKTLTAEEGVKVDTNKLTILIANNIFNPPDNALPVPVIKTFAGEHTDQEVDTIRKQAEQLITSPISISSGGLTFTLTVTDIKSLLTVLERPDGKDPKKIILSLRLDDIKLNQKLGDFAVNVENKTHAEFNDHDTRVAIYSQFYSGKRKLVEVPVGSTLLQASKAVLAAQSGEKFVYLTFDDGPNSIYHPMILDILKTYNVPATFFLVGQNTQRDIETAKRTVAEGHKIGNHSLTHTFLPQLTNASVVKEIQTTEDILKQIHGNQDIKLFRPPYGGINLSVENATDKLGLKTFLWDVDPRDWSEPSTDELVNRVVSNTVNGSDILLHSNHLATVKALPKIIEQLKARGFTFKTLE